MLPTPTPTPYMIKQGQDTEPSYEPEFEAKLDQETQLKISLTPHRQETILLSRVGTLPLAVPSSAQCKS